LQHGGIPEQYIHNYQVDLRRVNSEVLPDFHIPVSEFCIEQEERLPNYVCDSPASVISIIGEKGGPLQNETGVSDEPSSA